MFKDKLATPFLGYAKHFRITIHNKKREHPLTDNWSITGVNGFIVLRLFILMIVVYTEYRIL